MEANSDTSRSRERRDQEMSDDVPQEPIVADHAARDQALSLQARLVARQKAKMAALTAGTVAMMSDVEEMVKMEPISPGQAEPNSLDGNGSSDVGAQDEAQAKPMLESRDIATDGQDSQMQNDVEAQVATRFEEYLQPSGGSLQLESPSQEISSYDTELTAEAATDLPDLLDEAVQTSETHDKPFQEVIDLTATSDDAEGSDEPIPRRAYDQMYLRELQMLCQRRGFSKVGKKAFLVERLQAADEGGALPNPRARHFTFRRRARAHDMNNLATQDPMDMNGEQLQIRDYPAMAEGLRAQYQALLRLQPTVIQQHRQLDLSRQQGQLPLRPCGVILPGKQQLATGYWREQTGLSASHYRQSYAAPLPHFQGLQGPRPTSPPSLILPTAVYHRTLPRPMPRQDSRGPGYSYYAAMPASFGGLDLARNANKPLHTGVESANIEQDDKLRNGLHSWKKKHLEK